MAHHDGLPYEPEDPTRPEDPPRPEGAPITQVPEHPADPPESFPRPQATWPRAEGGVHSTAEEPVIVVHVNDEQTAWQVGPHDTLWLTVDGEGRGNTVAEWIAAAEDAAEARETLIELRLAKDRDVAVRAEPDPRQDSWQRLELLKVCGGDLALAREANAWIRDGGEPADTSGDLTMGQLGQIAYEAYFNETGGVSLVSGAPLPTWADQVPRIQRAWVMAAGAVLEATGR